MKRLAIMAGLAAIVFSGALVSDSVLTGSFAKITEERIAVTNPGGQQPAGQQDKDDPKSPPHDVETENQNPAGKAPAGQNKE